jgi:hypothetical protein
MVGAVLACAGTIWVINLRTAQAWTDAGAEWMRLPGHTPAGDLPQTFTVPEDGLSKAQRGEINRASLN